MSDLLGYTVRDSVTGITGIADQYVTILGSAPQYSVQPPSTDNKPIDGLSIDVGRLVLITDGPTATVEDADDTVIVELGDRVEDLISGFSGIVTSMNVFLNGCVYVIVTNRGKDGLIGDPKRLFTVHNRLKITEKNAFKAMWKAAHTEKSTVSEAPAFHRGGPVTRSSRSI